MARKYYLVDPHLLDDLPESASNFEHTALKILKDKNSSTSDKAQKLRELCTEVLGDNQQSDLQDIVNLLPKQIRSRAKVLLHSLKGKVVLDTDGANGFKLWNGKERVPFESNLIDLMRYALLPSNIKTAVTQETGKFMHVLQELNIPKSIIGAGKSINLNETPVEWNKLY